MDRKPNVLWIMADQLRAQALSINGDPNIHTPNIDNLARTGVNLTRAISGSPMCCPFRGSMLTGRYPHHSNVPGHLFPLDPKKPTIADVFNAYDYDTFYLGKWHLDGGEEDNVNNPVEQHIVPKELRGHFKTWIGYENNNAQYACYLHGHQENEELPLIRLKGYETDSLTDRMIEYLQTRSNSEAPFFAVLSVQPPHDPYVAPPEFAGRHSPATVKFRENVPISIKSVRERAAEEISGYNAMVENLDYNVGRLVKVLEDENLMQNTHIIFFSDHGDMLGSHGQYRKTTMYEEAIRVPFIISGENRDYTTLRNKGSRDDILINHVDIAPTTLGLCDLPIPKWMEGTDYSYCRRRDRIPPKQIPDSAFIQLVVPTKHWDSINKPFRGIVTKDGYKYACFEKTDWLLFNLNEDPYEQVNLAHNSMAYDLRKRLKKELKNWIQETGDQFVLPEEN